MLKIHAVHARNNAQQPEDEKAAQFLRMPSFQNNIPVAVVFVVKRKDIYRFAIGPVFFGKNLIAREFLMTEPVIVLCPR